MTKYAAATPGGTAQADDVFGITRDPTGTPLDRSQTPADLLAYIIAATSVLLKSNETATLTAGFDVVAFDAGSQATGTFTPDPASGNLQTATNDGAHISGVPATDCSMVVRYTNGAAAGAITQTAWTKVDGDTLTTTQGDIFMFYMTVIGATSHLTIRAMQ